MVVMRTDAVFRSFGIYGCYLPARNVKESDCEQKGRGRGEGNEGVVGEWLRGCLLAAA